MINTCISQVISSQRILKLEHVAFTLLIKSDLKWCIYLSSSKSLFIFKLQFHYAAILNSFNFISIHLFPRIKVMLDLICMGIFELLGKRKYQNERFLQIVWFKPTNPDYEVDAYPLHRAGHFEHEFLKFNIVLVLWTHVYIYLSKFLSYHSTSWTGSAVSVNGIG